MTSTSSHRLRAGQALHPPHPLPQPPYPLSSELGRGGSKSANVCPLCSFGLEAAGLSLSFPLAPRARGLLATCEQAHDCGGSRVRSHESRLAAAAPTGEFPVLRGTRDVSLGDHMPKSVEGDREGQTAFLGELV